MIPLLVKNIDRYYMGRARIACDNKWNHDVVPFQVDIDIRQLLMIGHFSMVLAPLSPDTDIQSM